MSSTLCSLLPSTTNRVSANTADTYNEQIRLDTERRVAQLARLGNAAIDRRLEELDCEWDVERLLEANAATAVLTFSLLGMAVNRRFFVMPMVVGGFLLQHAVQGWCPPLPIFRSMGVRTQTEIDEERYALKALRGDFATTSGSQPGNRSASQALAAARS
jgi:hypothetical protein